MSRRDRVALATVLLLALAALVVVALRLLEPAAPLPGRPAGPTAEAAPDEPPLPDPPEDPGAPAPPEGTAAEHRRDVSIERIPTGRFAVEVRDAFGEPVAGARVVPVPPDTTLDSFEMPRKYRDGPRLLYVATGEQGSAEIDVPVGRYRIVVVREPAPPAITGVREIGPGDVHEVSVTLEPGATVYGTVYGTGGAKLPGAGIGWVTGGRIERLRADGDAAYSIDGVGPGAYAVEVTGPEGSYTQEVRVPEGVPRVHVDLGPAPGQGVRLSGRVLRDGAPLPAAKVRLASMTEPGSPGSMLTTSCDSAGRYVLEGVPRGRARVFLERPPDEPPRGRYTVWIEVPDRPEATIDLRFPHGEIHGRVLLPPVLGEEGPRPRLELYPVLPAATHPVRTSDFIQTTGEVVHEDGRFEIRRVPPGRYTLLVEHERDRRSEDRRAGRVGVSVHGIVVGDAPVDLGEIDLRDAPPTWRVEGVDRTDDRGPVRAGIYGAWLEHASGDLACIGQTLARLPRDLLDRSGDDLLVFTRRWTPVRLPIDGIRLAGDVLPLELSPPVKARILVRTPDGSPAPGASVTLFDSEGRWARNLSFDRTAATGADGVYEPMTLAPGTYRAEARWRRRVGETTFTAGRTQTEVQIFVRR